MMGGKHLTATNVVLSGSPKPLDLAEGPIILSPAGMLETMLPAMSSAPRMLGATLTSGLAAGLTPGLPLGLLTLGLTPGLAPGLVAPGLVTGLMPTPGGGTLGRLPNIMANDQIMAEHVNLEIVMKQQQQMQMSFCLAEQHLRLKEQHLRLQEEELQMLSKAVKRKQQQQSSTPTTTLPSGLRILPLLLDQPLVHPEVLAQQARQKFLPQKLQRQTPPVQSQPITMNWQLPPPAPIVQQPSHWQQLAELPWVRASAVQPDTTSTREPASEPPAAKKQKVEETDIVRPAPYKPSTSSTTPIPPRDLPSKIGSGRTDGSSDFCTASLSGQKQLRLLSDRGRGGRK